MGTVLTVNRRFAAGIDVSERAVRLAVVSKRMHAHRPVCVERLEEVLLPKGAVVCGDFIDRAAISAALREAFSRLPARGALRSLRCAMAVPASATLTTRVPLEKLSSERQKPGRDPRGLLEPAVLAEAERIAGIERGALSVDWSIHERNDGTTEVSIAATGRQYVESRVEAAAGADIVLSAIDGEPVAALRALCYSAAIEINRDERFVACWIESSGLHAWIVGEDGVENELRYPSPEYSSAIEALTDLIGKGPCMHWIYIAGDIELLHRAGVSAQMLTIAFGCPVMPFECAPFCNGAQRVDERLAHSPLFAVALGLALREVTS
ncbi:type IV pilus biogenesis protein PilM [Caballeronia sp. DA-9]|uniref:type IV pilus biogenesis protein PilM n=1 Tax=Caballeronia sp. DA-9 TaxID=3436237 RepID=UPI003F675351